MRKNIRKNNLKIKKTKSYYLYLAAQKPFITSILKVSSFLPLFTHWENINLTWQLMISNGMGIHGSKEHCLDIAKTLQNF